MNHAYFCVAEGATLATSYNSISRNRRDTEEEEKIERRGGLGTRGEEETVKKKSLCFSTPVLCPLPRGINSLYEL